MNRKLKCQLVIQQLFLEWLLRAEHLQCSECGDGAIYRALWEHCVEREPQHLDQIQLVVESVLDMTLWEG